MADATTYDISSIVDAGNNAPAVPATTTGVATMGSGIANAAASSAIGAGVSGLFSIINNGLNYLYQKKMASYQNELNLKNWKMQNEYNSPSAQMARFAEAGLNPNLIYGNGTNGNATAAPEATTPKDVDMSIMPKFDIQDIMSLGKYSQEIRNMTQQRQVLHAMERLNIGKADMNDIAINLRQHELHALGAYMYDRYIEDGGNANNFDWHLYTNEEVTPDKLRQWRSTPYYLSYQKQHVGYEQASELLDKIKNENKILAHQDWLNSGLEDVFGQGSNNTIYRIFYELLKIAMHK